MWRRKKQIQIYASLRPKNTVNTFEKPLFDENPRVVAPEFRLDKPCTIDHLWSASVSTSVLGGDTTIVSSRRRAGGSRALTPATLECFSATEIIPRPHSVERNRVEERSRRRRVETIAGTNSRTASAPTTVPPCCDVCARAVPDGRGRSGGRGGRRVLGRDQRSRWHHRRGEQRPGQHVGGKSRTTRAVRATCLPPVRSDIGFLSYFFFFPPSKSDTARQLPTTRHRRHVRPTRY